MVAPAALAERGVEQLDVAQDVELERLGQPVVLGDDAAQSPDGAPPQQRPQDAALLALDTKAERLKQNSVRGLVLRVDERVEQAVEHLLGVIGRWRALA
jgi:hypothetical protein